MSQFQINTSEINLVTNYLYKNIEKKILLNYFIIY